jgi:hypothetical protein
MSSGFMSRLRVHMPRRHRCTGRDRRRDRAFGGHLPGPCPRPTPLEVCDHNHLRSCAAPRAAGSEDEISPVSWGT